VRASPRLGAGANHAVPDALILDEKPMSPRTCRRPKVMAGLAVRSVLRAGIAERACARFYHPEVTS